MKLVLVSSIKIRMLKKKTKKKNKVLNKKVSPLCEWFIDIMLKIHFGDDKRETIHFSRGKATI